MKKWLSLILAAALLLSLAACGAKTEPTKTVPAETAPAAAEPTARPEDAEPEAEAEPETAAGSDALPAVGDTVEGFTVTEVRDFPLVGGTAVLFEHGATGARLMYIANNDTDRVFDLTFFTRAVDNTGLPHVFEHATLNGSEKYPSSALFFNLMNQTYNTYMNAATYPLMTTYPVASLSEEQLLRYADFYTDSCLHPMVLSDESIYREEAWRYRLADADAPLTLEGTVYSEMLAAMDLDSWAMFNLLRAAFPGSTIGNVSGGDPAFIPDMTWEALKEYHERYYHPSNCIAYLYGEFEDYAAFLKLLDEAFSPYEKREFTFEDPDYEPITGPVEKTVAYPVEASSDTENRATVCYAILCPGVREDAAEELTLNTLTDLLAPAASPLMQRLKKALPSGSFSVYIETEGPEDAVMFMGQNLNSEDAAIFRSTVDEVLAETAEKGFAAELLDSIAASLTLSNKLTREASGVGVDLISTIAYSCASSGRPFDYLDYVEALNELEQWNAEGRYQKAIRDWLLDSETTALVTTYPQPGLREELDAAETERLAAVKSAMDADELAALVESTNAEKEEDDASAYVEQLQAVTVESLPEEIASYDVSDELGADGVRRLTAQAGVDGVGTVVLLLDAAGLPQEDIHWFALYTALLGEMDTASHSREELATLTTRYLYGGEIRLSLLRQYETGAFNPYLRAGWTAERDDLAAGYDLMSEILYETSFDDAETLQGLISRNKASLKSAITNSPYEPLLYRSFGAGSPLYAYYSYFNYLEYYAFLEEVEQAAEADPSAVAEKLRSVQEYFRNRTNAVAAFVGDAETIETNAPLADAFFAALDSRPVEPVEYDLPVSAARTGLIVDSGVQYNAIVADYETMGLDGYSAELDAVALLVTDAYLMPMLREQYGVYTPMHGFSPDAGGYLLTYRDPNVMETFNVYEALGEFLSEMDADQETLDGFILSAYAGYAMPSGELQGAMDAVLAVLEGEPADLELTYMRQLKSLTPEKLAEYVSAYEKLAQQGIRFTAGGAAVIHGMESMFDEIFDPFGTEEKAASAMEDVPEDSEYYEAIQFVYENGIMEAADDTRFGADDPARAGELAGFLYALIGGDPADRDGALGFLADNGIVDGSVKTDDALTGRAADRMLRSFSRAAQVPYTLKPAVSDDALTRAQLAQLMLDYYDSLPLE